MREDRVRIFLTLKEKPISRPFKIFLDHTDQKRNAKRWLQEVVDGLPTRTVFIDCRRGEWRTHQGVCRVLRAPLPSEPNVYLLNQLQHSLPTVEVLGLPILAAQPAVQGDLVLCSHTFYYVPADEWSLHLERLVSWMAPTGVTIVVLQHCESGCMHMVRHFFGHRFELRQVAEAFRMQARRPL